MGVIQIIRIAIPFCCENESQENSYSNSRAFCESELTFQTTTSDMAGIIIIFESVRVILSHSIFNSAKSLLCVCIRHLLLELKSGLFLIN